MINTVEKMYDPISGSFDNYKITLTNGKILFVPHNEENKDYQAIQEWAKIEGNNITDNGA
jgi:hypothetical protein